MPIRPITLPAEPNARFIAAARIVTRERNIDRVLPLLLESGNAIFCDTLFDGSLFKNSERLNGLNLRLFARKLQSLNTDTGQSDEVCIFARLMLGVMYSFGLGVNQDVGKAILLLSSDGVKDLPGAKVALGNLYVGYVPGVGRRVDHQKAFEYFSGVLEGESGLSDNSRAYKTALYRLARMYYKGEAPSCQDGAPDYARAVDYFRLAKNAGSLAAMGMLSEMYRLGQVPSCNGVPDFKKALGLMKRAIRLGYKPPAEPLRPLTVISTNSNDLDRAREVGEGMKLCRQAVYAEVNKPFNPPDPEKAFKLYKESALWGNEKAFLQVLDLYASGLVPIHPNYTGYDEANAYIFEISDATLKSQMIRIRFLLDDTHSPEIMRRALITGLGIYIGTRVVKDMAPLFVDNYAQRHRTFCFEGVVIDALVDSLTLCELPKLLFTLDFSQDAKRARTDFAQGVEAAVKEVFATPDAKAVLEQTGPDYDDSVLHNVVYSVISDFVAARYPKPPRVSLNEVCVDVLDLCPFVGVV